MKIKKTLYLYIITSLLIFILYQFPISCNGGKRELRFYNHFNNTDINGKLEYAKIGYHGTVFKIEGVEEEFVFYPHTSNLNNKKIFYQVAEKGDLIIKHSYADTLKLKKDNIVYLYTFQKFK